MSNESEELCNGKPEEWFNGPYISTRCSVCHASEYDEEGNDIDLRQPHKPDLEYLAEKAIAAPLIEKQKQLEAERDQLKRDLTESRQISYQLRERVSELFNQKEQLERRLLAERAEIARLNDLITEEARLIRENQELAQQLEAERNAVVDLEAEIENQGGLIAAYDQRCERLEQLLHAYRMKRANDGCYKRNYDMLAHGLAEEEIVRLEAEMAAFDSN